MTCKSISTALAAALTVFAATASWAESGYRGHDDHYYQSNMDARIEMFQNLGRTDGSYKDDADEYKIEKKEQKNFGEFLGGAALGVAAGIAFDR